MKRCSASLAIREMQIKTTMSYHLTLVGTPIINKSSDNVLERLWSKGSPCSLQKGMQTGAATEENRMEDPQKIKNRVIIYHSKLC